VNGDVTPAGPIHISMAVDRGFEVPLAVSLLSIAEAHQDSDTPCEVTVMCAGLDGDVYRAIERDVAGRVAIDWQEVDLTRLAGASYTVGLSSATLFRILLPDLLPASRTRTIYLDADTLVRRPLVEIWCTGMGNHLLAAVRDAGAPFPAGPSGTDWRSMGLAPDTDYFNAGLLVLPLDRWRAEQTAAATMELLRTRAMRWGDQDALNVVAQRRWYELPRRWNVQTADALEQSLSWALWNSDVQRAVQDPAVIHYTGMSKPWNGKTDHPFAEAWFATLARSSWAGWSPDGPSAAARVRRRMTRAAQVVLHG
jgi:lipopolysaccharide biosynthesis glycosyltransferase